MSARVTRWLAAGLLTVHAGLLLDAARRDFVTIDEAAHLAAGISYWKTGRFGMFGVNPPLPRMIAVLPVLAAGPDTSAIHGTDNVATRAEFAAGERFAQANADRYLTLLFLARLAGVGWSLLGGWIVFRWAKELYGQVGGLLALTVWCFEPNILAHAHLLTSDMPATVAGLAATYVFWKYLREPSLKRAVFAGLLLGVALLTKFTLLVLLVLWPILAIIYRLGAKGSGATGWPLPGPESKQRIEDGQPVPGRRRWKTASGHAALIGGASLFVLNLGYEFDGTGTPLGRLSFVSKLLGGEDARLQADANRFRDTRLADVPIPVPKTFLLGIDVQARDFEPGSQLSYLRGEWRYPGWWYWYLYALGVKLPIGTWALILAALTITLWGSPPLTPDPSPPRGEKGEQKPLSPLGERGRGEGVLARDEWTLWLSALALLAFVSVNTGFTNHLRYALPCLPFAIVAVGKLAYVVYERHWTFGGFLAVMLLWSIVGVVRIHPHYLSYFNELAGGLQSGHRHLIDSNLDWGQDLTYLKQWLDEHPEARPIKLAYFGIVDPRTIGVEFELPPFGVEAMIDSPEKWPEAGPQPGWFAVSINHVVGHPRIGAFDSQGNRRALPPGAYRYFRRFEPAGRAGYSILIYRITPNEANAVRLELGMSEISAP